MSNTDGLRSSRLEYRDVVGIDGRYGHRISRVRGFGKIRGARIYGLVGELWQAMILGSLTLPGNQRVSFGFGLGREVGREVGRGVGREVGISSRTKVE